MNARSNEVMSEITTINAARAAQIANIVPVIETITPERARELLALNTNNRKINLAVVKRLEEAMKKGHWVFNGDAIRISKSGKLLDGQHRLTAVVGSGITCQMMVISDLPDSVFTTIDTGRQRTVADMIDIEHIKNACVTAGATNLIMKYDMGAQPCHTGHDRFFSKREMVEFILKNKDELAVSAHFISCSKFFKKAISPSYGCFAHYIMGRIDPVMRDEFFKKVETGLDCEPTSPEWVLREKLIDSMSQSVYKEDNFTKSAYLIFAWNNARMGKQCKQIKWIRQGQRKQDYPRAQ